jgi:hypothetical protein
MVGLAAVALVAGAPAREPGLAGAWSSSVQFQTGPFAAVKDLELLYVFNQGGTMTESSNYDASPPVPRAYGIWRQTGANRYEAKHVYYNTKPPARFEDITGGGGWSPAGSGTLVEKIVLSRDGRSFDSAIKLEMVDTSGKHSDGGRATGHGTRMRF